MRIEYFYFKSNCYQMNTYQRRPYLCKHLQQSSFTDNRNLHDMTSSEEHKISSNAEKVFFASG